MGGAHGHRVSGHHGAPRRDCMCVCALGCARAVVRSAAPSDVHSGERAPGVVTWHAWAYIRAEGGGGPLGLDWERLRAFHSPSSFRRWECPESPGPPPSAGGHPGARPRWRVRSGPAHELRRDPGGCSGEGAPNKYLLLTACGCDWLSNATCGRSLMVTPTERVTRDAASGRASGLPEALVRPPSV